MDLPFDIAIPLLGIYLKEPKPLILKNISTPMFVVTLFTIAKIWKQPKCPSIDVWITTVGQLHNGILFECKKENFTLCNSMDGPGEHYAKWNMPVRERKIPFYFTDMCNLMNKLNKHNWDRLIEGQQMISWGREVRGWRDWAKKKKDSWTWATVWWLLGGRGIRGLNNNGDYTMKI